MHLHKPTGAYHRATPEISCLVSPRPPRYRVQTFELPMMLGFEGSNRFALALALPMHRKAGVTAKRGNWSRRSVLPHRGRCIYVAGPALFLCAAGMTE